MITLFLRVELPKMCSVSNFIGCQVNDAHDLVATCTDITHTFVTFKFHM